MISFKGTVFAIGLRGEISLKSYWRNKEKIFKDKEEESGIVRRKNNSSSLVVGLSGLERNYLPVRALGRKPNVSLPVVGMFVVRIKKIRINLENPVLKKKKKKEREKGTIKRDRKNSLGFRNRIESTTTTTTMNKKKFRPRFRWVERKKDSMLFRSFFSFFLLALEAATATAPEAEAAAAAAAAFDRIFQEPGRKTGMGKDDEGWEYYQQELPLAAPLSPPPPPPPPPAATAATAAAAAAA
ncbi:hypothetical protein M0802_002714 [Mischocyttarus mexicanus]|nr:hypothetical protein M0802_002714 [Mischocyttarus mexicanus]